MSKTSWLLAASLIAFQALSATPVDPRFGGSGWGEDCPPKEPYWCPHYQNCYDLAHRPDDCYAPPSKAGIQVNDVLSPGQGIQEDCQERSTTPGCIATRASLTPSAELDFHNLPDPIVTSESPPVDVDEGLPESENIPRRPTIKDVHGCHIGSSWCETLRLCLPNHRVSDCPNEPFVKALSKAEIDTQDDGDFFIPSNSRADPTRIKKRDFSDCPINYSWCDHFQMCLPANMMDICPDSNDERDGTVGVDPVTTDGDERPIKVQTNLSKTLKGLVN